MVAGQSTTGFSARRWLLTAIVTGVSVIERASFASVLPVQGQTSRMSVMSFGPSGSASWMVRIGSWPEICRARFKWSSARPNRVSRDAA